MAVAYSNKDYKELKVFEERAVHHLAHHLAKHLLNSLQTGIQIDRESIMALAVAESIKSYRPQMDLEIAFQRAATDEDFAAYIADVSVKNAQKLTPVFDASRHALICEVVQKGVLALNWDIEATNAVTWHDIYHHAPKAIEDAETRGTTVVQMGPSSLKWDHQPKGEKGVTYVPVSPKESVGEPVRYL